MIRSTLRALSGAGVIPLMYDVSGQSPLAGLDDIVLTRDLETWSADVGTRLVFIRDVDPEHFLDPAYCNIAVVDMAPDADDHETISVLRRFDAVLAASQWVAQALDRIGIQAQWIGRICETPERACLPRRQFDLPDSAFVVVIPFDPDEMVGPVFEGVYLDFAQALLAADRTGQMRIAVMASSSALDLPVFPDDPRVSVHDVAADDLLCDSLLNAADCVVSFEALLRMARSLGRAAWMGRPVLAMRQSADLDLPVVGPSDSALDDATSDSLVQEYVARIVQMQATGQGGDLFNVDPASISLAELSYRAVGLRLKNRLIEFST